MRAVLSDRDVAKIRRLYAEGVKQVNLAERFGVSQPYVSYLVRGKRRNGTAVKLLEARSGAS